MLEKHLQRHFKFSAFRSGQKEIVESILAGEDVVALMPTGGGKSLCYQLPAILSEHLTIVISPLIALMKDQVDSLNARGISATYINSSLTQDEIQTRIQAIQSGQVRILYIAPERFMNTAFRQWLASVEVSIFAVDEAHCVSQWGHDFRREYLSIGEHIKLLKKRPCIAAFTATATEEVKNDIIDRLYLQKPQVFIRGFDRPNLQFFAQKDLKPLEKQREMLRIIQSLQSQGSGIVYTLSRKEAEKNALYLRKNGISARAYHAGMDASKREKTQNDFMENRFQVIVATVAFGMGVDKADVRFVIHTGMPGSLENYYQEAGRAGRDGEKSYCILLHGKRDVSMHRYFMAIDRNTMRDQGKSYAEIEERLALKQSRLDEILKYTTTTGCRRNVILAYFNDPDTKDERHNCKGCDVCLGWKNTDRARMSTRRVLRKKDPDELSNTIMETVHLYQQGSTPGKIAKMRSLGVSTIFGHLVEWYGVGGAFPIEEYVTHEEEKLITKAIQKAKKDNPKSLRAIKDLLPKNINYEQIRMIIAKQEKDV